MLGEEKAIKFILNSIDEFWS